MCYTLAHNLSILALKSNHIKTVYLATVFRKGPQLKEEIIINKNTITMSLWTGLTKRSNGCEVRKEDIHKATLEVRITSTESFGAYCNTRLTAKQRRSFRWHNYHLSLKDERFGSYTYWRGGIITRLGDTGKNTIQGFIDDVLKEYQYFDGYACDDLENKKSSDYLTDKSRTMVSLVRQKIRDHNDQMMLEEE